jgi:hypothetical protein
MALPMANVYFRNVAADLEKHYREFQQTVTLRCSHSDAVRIWLPERDIARNRGSPVRQTRLQTVDYRHGSANSPALSHSAADRSRGPIQVTPYGRGAELLGPTRNGAISAGVGRRQRRRCSGSPLARTR